MPEEAAVMEAPSQAPETNEFAEAGNRFQEALDQASGAPALNAVPPNQLPPEDAKTTAKPVTEKPKAVTKDQADEPKSILPKGLFGKPEKAEEAASSDKPDDEPFAAELPASASEKAKANWKAARTAHENLKLKYEALEKEATAAKSTAGKPADKEIKERIAAIEKERDEFRDELQKSRFEATPRFKRLLSEEQRQITSLKDYLKGTEIDESIIDLAAVAKGAARRKLLDDAGIDGALRADITGHLVELDKISAAKERDRGDYSKLLEEHQTEQTLLEQQKAKAEREHDESEFRQVTEELQNNPFYKRDASDAKWNAGLEEDLELARRHMFGEVSVKQFAETVIRGARAKRLEEVAMQLNEQVEAQAETIRKMTAVRPGAGNGAPKTERFVASNDASGNPDDIRAAREAEFLHAGGQG